MNIQQDKKKQDLGQDPVIEGVVKAKEFMVSNSTALIISLAAVVIIVVGVLVVGKMKESSIRKAQEIFGVAMLDHNDNQLDKALNAFSDVANNYRHTPQGTMSAFMMGSIYLQQQNYDQAITWFETALSGKDAGFAGAQALEGLASAYEFKGDMTSALNYLQKALNDDRLKHRHSAIRWKMALINQNSNTAVSGKLCNEIIADTNATEYHQKAENLLAILNVKAGVN